MEKIKHLFVFFLKIAFAIFFIVFLVRVMGAILHVQTKSGAVSSNASSTPPSDILPSPRKYSGFFTSTTATTGSKVKGNTFVAPEPFVYTGPIASVNGNANSNNTSVIKSPDGYTYNTYDYSAYPTTVDANGNYVVKSSQTNTQTQSTGAIQSDTAADRRLMIRNLSIYQGAHLYTGLAFVGEARSTMFREGKFPIAVIDATGKFVGVSTAVAQTNWTVPGWVRFETKITYPLPSAMACTMVFQEALTASEQKLRAPNHIALGVNCN
jgi:hypothetical protein